MRKQGRQSDVAVWRPRWPLGKPFHSGLGRMARKRKPLLASLAVKGSWRYQGEICAFPPSLILIYWETRVSLFVDRKESVERGTFENTKKEDRIKNTAEGVSIGVLVLERRGISFEQRVDTEIF